VRNNIDDKTKQTERQLSVTRQIQNLVNLHYQAPISLQIHTKSQPGSTNPRYPTKEPVSLRPPLNSPRNKKEAGGARDHSFPWSNSDQARHRRAAHFRWHTKPPLKSRVSHEISWRSRHRTGRGSPDPRHGDPTHQAFRLTPLRARAAPGQLTKLEFVRFWGGWKLRTLRGGGEGSSEISTGGAELGRTELRRGGSGGDFIVAGRC
jgi:hypothetical protein